jgi:hypothetical protein
MSTPPPTKVELRRPPIGNYRVLRAPGQTADKRRADDRRNRQQRQLHA